MQYRNNFNFYTFRVVGGSLRTLHDVGCAVLLSVCAVAPVAAEEMPKVTITGFGTLALTRTNTDEAEFAQPSQASGAKKAFRTGVDSNFGIQASLKLSERLSLTAQGLVSKTATEAYGADLTWAFAKYKLHDDWTIRVGRTTPPIYLISDFRNVGYANLMMRPSSPVYGQIPSPSIDGVDLLYQRGFDDTTVTAQLGFGNGKRNLPNGTYVDFRPMTTLHVVVENGPLTLRYGHVDSTFSFGGSTALPVLLTALRSVGQMAVAEALEPSDMHGRFDSIGITLDYKKFVWQTEYAKRHINSRLLPSTTSWYTMFAYRYGKVTPFYSHGDARQDSPRNFAELPLSGPLAMLSASANRAAKAPQERINTVGIRWDVASSVALKVQMDRIKPLDGAGWFLNPTAKFSGPVNVYAAGVDFVF